jgi:hypothetical protein
MKDQTRPEKKERHTRKKRLNPQISGKEGKKESDSLGRLLMLGTLGFLGGLLWIAYQKTISAKKKQKPEIAPQVPLKEESVEELARRLRELFVSPTPEGQEELKRARQKEILEKLQSRMKRGDWQRVEEILRKPKTPQGR